METQTKATRTPGVWVSEGSRILTFSAHPVCVVAQCATLTTITGDEAIANARFIVRACNSFDALLATCEDAIGTLDRASNGGLKRPLAKTERIGDAKAVMRRARDDLREAIAKANK